MTQWDRLPSSFQFAVQDTPQKDIVKVFNASSGRLQNNGRTVQVAPFAKENMDKIAQIIARLRTQKQPAIEYITNIFIDIHRSSGRSHVVGAILTNGETLGDYFDLDTAAKQGLANKMANCDRANAAGYRLISLFDIKDPVLYHWTTEGNHNTGLVGDPRMPKYGKKNTVVMDTYPIFPMPHTLAEASYHVRIPREGEEGHADLEIWHPQKNAARRFDASHLPAPISDQQQREWLQERGWPTRFGADVVKAWHDAEVSETGEVPNRWKYLFSCKDPSVVYDDGQGNIGANNNFPLEYVQQRVEAFLQLHQAYPEDASRSQGMALEGARLASRRSSRLPGEPRGLPIARQTPMPDAGPSDTAPPSSDIMPRPAIGMAFQHVTPMDTIVTDLHTGEVLMEMHGSQVPVDKVNHGFPIKDPAKPYAIHPDYVSPTDPFRCHDNVKIGRVELPPETRIIMQQYFPAEAAEPDYFDKRAAEVKAEYEAPLPLNNATPPSATQWRPVRLTADQCYGDVQAKALADTFGVIPVDYKKQNVGGMGPAFAGAEIKTAAQRRQNIAKTSKEAFDDFSMRAGNPKNPAEVVRFAPYGGGNLAQFMNGKASPEEQAHFIAVDVIVHTTNKYGEPRRVVAPHFFQIAEVPEGKQAILDYGNGNYFYGGNRPGLPSTAQGASRTQPEIKSEPIEDGNMRMDDVPIWEAITPSALALRHKRPVQGDGEQEPKRLRTSSTQWASGSSDVTVSPIHSRRSTRASATALMARLQRQQSPVGLGGNTSMADESQIMHQKDGPAVSRLQSLPFEATGDDDSSSLSSVPDAALENSDFESFGMEEPASANAKRGGGQQIKSGYNKKDDGKIISSFPAEVWEKAQERAQAPGLPEGVKYREATSQTTPRYTAMRKIAGKVTSLGSFSVTGGREDATAKAMAIASMMMAEIKHGAVRKRDDAQVISEFPPDIWEEAQAQAKKPGLPAGVALQKMNIHGKSPHYFYKAYMSINGRQQVLANFSITNDRNDTKAKAMAIATRMAAEVDHGVAKQDEATIARFPIGIWKTAQTRASQPGLPPGVTFHAATDKRPTPHYQIHLKQKSYGAFSVVNGRDDVKARALAIATRMAAEAEVGGVKNDAQIIAQFPAGVWESAQAMAKEPGLPRGVSFFEATNRTAPRYVAGIKIKGKQRTLGSFSVTADRDDATAKALAIAKRRTAELQEAR